MDRLVSLIINANRSFELHINKYEVIVTQSLNPIQNPWLGQSA